MSESTQSQGESLKNFFRITLALVFFTLALFGIISLISNKHAPTAQEVVSNMSLRQKVAQMFMFYYPGTNFSSSQLEKIKQEAPGGMIVMGDNIKDFSQLKKFTRDFAGAIKSASKSRAGEILEPLIAVDQEGGLVKRIKWDDSPSAKELTSLSTDDVCLQSSKRAKLLKESGINVNFAPVVDVETDTEAFINNRTISKSPAEISRVATSFVECSQKQGVSATLKHFPGHGATTEDSHFVVPKIDIEKDEWLLSHGKVFTGLIEQANPDLVMAGHLEFSKIDPKPATLSQEVITDLLKGELGFEGVVITDDMAQLHTATQISHSEAITQAILAGVDMILYINTGPYDHSELIGMAVSQVESGGIPESRINDAALRIVNLKLKKLRD